MKAVKTLSIDDRQIQLEDFESQGALSDDAACIVMKALYGARFIEYNFLWPIFIIARRISCWSTADDRRLRRLILYIHHTHNETLQNFVCDSATDLSVMLWVDASLAEYLSDSKSTSGAYLAIVGPNSFAPIMGFARKQTAMFHASIDIEIIALEEAVRIEGLPILTFWETIVCILSDRLATMLTSVTVPTNRLNNHLIILCTLKLPIATLSADLFVRGGGTFHRDRVTQ